jgi:hypothetical protein
MDCMICPSLDDCQVLDGCVERYLLRKDGQTFAGLAFVGAEAIAIMSIAGSAGVWVCGTLKSATKPTPKRRERSITVFPFPEWVLSCSMRA